MQEQTSQDELETDPKPEPEPEPTEASATTTILFNAMPRGHGIIAAPPVPAAFLAAYLPGA